jgi:hypothetical protein
MDYELQFLRSYSGQPRLSWSVYLEGHEPSFRAMSALDADLAAHLRTLRDEHGEKTAVRRDDISEIVGYTVSR